MTSPDLSSVPLPPLPEPCESIQSINNQDQDFWSEGQMQDYARLAVAEDRARNNAEWKELKVGLDKYRSGRKLFPAAIGCREEDRAMLATDAGKELVRAVAEATKMPSAPRDEELNELVKHLEKQAWQPTESGDIECFDQGQAMAAQAIQRLRAENARLKEERDSFQRVGITTLERAEAAERSIAELMTDESATKIAIAAIAGYKESAEYQELLDLRDALEKMEIARDEAIDQRDGFAERVDGYVEHMARVADWERIALDAERELDELRLINATLIRAGALELAAEGAQIAGTSKVPPAPENRTLSP